MNLFLDIELLQIQQNTPSKASVRAVDFLGQLAQKCGATVLVESSFPHDSNSFTGRGKQILKGNQTPVAWAKEKPNRILLVANAMKEIAELEGTSAVVINMESWHSEATLFAQAGLAYILGDPKREPLVPAGNYSSSTIAYAAFAGLASVYCKLKRFQKTEVAQVNGVAALAWANWKSIAAGQMGKILKREGAMAEWPALTCKDGYVSFIFHVLLWDNIVKMVGDEQLKEERFSTFKGREENRDAYMSIIRDWVADKTKEEIKNLFFEYGIPGAPILNLSEILEDKLFAHRNAFANSSNGTQIIKSPVAPHRIPNLVSNNAPAMTHRTAKTELPLAGIRVLDLGIITAGAGSSAVLADMGAEVLKIESKRYADPFRRWAGSSDSPLFKYNNRNKYGVAIDLKTEEGKNQLRELIKTADVIVENFRRGVLDRMGFSFEAVKALNPTIVLASISGQGLDGPQSSGATFGSTLEANAGLSTLSTYENGVPYVTGRNGNYPDQTVCLYAAAAIALAIQKSKAENCALQIDVSQRDVAMYMIGDILEWASHSKVNDLSTIKKEFAEYEVNQFFATSDNRWVMVSANQLVDFQKIESLENTTDISRIAAWIKTKSSDELGAFFHPADIGVATALDGQEVYEKTNIQAKNAFLKTPKGILVKGFPFELVHTPMTIWGESPEVGEHTSQFL